MKEQDTTYPITTTKLKEGTPTRVMFRKLTILNPGESTDQSKRVPAMAKIGGGAPITRPKGNLMEFARTIQTTSILNGMEKITRRENPTKKAGPSVQGMVKNQLEIGEV